MVGSGLSNIQGRKAQGRYGKRRVREGVGGGGVLKKTFDIIFRRIRAVSR